MELDNAIGDIGDDDSTTATQLTAIATDLTAANAVWAEEKKWLEGAGGHS